MEIARKITLGTINGVRKGFKDIKSVTFLARVFGVANSASVEPTPSGGTETKFVGEFGAVNMERKAFGAPVVFLPAQAEIQLQGVLAAAGGKPVQFAFDIFATPNVSPVGYSITTQALIDPKPMTVLLDLAASLPDLPPVADLLSGQESEPGASQGENQPTGEAGSPPPAPAPAPAPQTKPAGKTVSKGASK